MLLQFSLFQTAPIYYPFPLPESSLLWTFLPPRAADNSSRVFLPQSVLFLILGFPLQPECLYTFLPPFPPSSLPPPSPLPLPSFVRYDSYFPVVLSNRSHSETRVERKAAPLRMCDVRTSIARIGFAESHALYVWRLRPYSTQVRAQYPNKKAMALKTCEHARRGQ